MLFNIIITFNFYLLGINVDFHKLDEYSSSLLKKSQQENSKKDTFLSVSN